MPTEESLRRNSTHRSAAPARFVPQISRRAWILALLSGGLQIVIFPHANLYFLSWVAIAPLLVALMQARRSDHGWLPATVAQGFLLAMTAGFVASAGQWYWVVYTMRVYGGLETPVAIGVLILLALVLGAIAGSFGLLVALAARWGIRAVVLAPAFWIVCELLRTRIFGVPWNLLGTTQVDNIPLTRIATITGVYGLSFEIVLVNSAFAVAVLASRGRRLALAIAAAVGATALQIGTIASPPAVHADRTARLVQSNVPILYGPDWTPEYFARTISELIDLSIPQPGELAPGVPAPDIVVWPESPAPFYINVPEFRNAVSEAARKAHAYFVVGSLGLNNTGDPNADIFNSAALIIPSGDWVARYDKIHLVPWGEYVPYKTIFRFADKMTREVSNFGRGTDRQVLVAGDLRLGVFICYESIFPDEVRQFANNGAQVFVNISNDGWFGHTAGPLQHLRMARMRAIENRRWLLRGTNTGVTASIDPYGRVVSSAPRDVRSALDAPYSLIRETTFYTRHGDWFAWTCVIISLVAVTLRLGIRKDVLRH